MAIRLLIARVISVQTYHPSHRSHHVQEVSDVQLKVQAWFLLVPAWDALINLSGDPLSWDTRKKHGVIVNIRWLKFPFVYDIKLEYLHILILREFRLVDETLIRKPNSQIPLSARKHPCLIQTYCG
jgi:hypothetical protein